MSLPDSSYGEVIAWNLQSDRLEINFSFDVGKIGSSVRLFLFWQG